MAIGQDTFIKENQSGWNPASDGQLWTKFGPGTLAITSNKGVLTASNGADTHVQLGFQTAENMEVSCRIAIGHSGDICGVQGRFTANGGNTTTYKLLWYSGSIHLNKAVNGANTQMTDVAFVMNPGTFYFFRLLVSGSNLFGRIWQSGNAEPSHWMTTTSDSQVQGAGGFAVLGLTHPSSTGIQFDSFLASVYPVALPDTRTQQTLDTFLTLDNWVSLAAPSGACAARSDLPGSNNYNCQTGYFAAGAYRNSNALALNGGLVAHADVLSGEKHGWQIRSRQSFPLPGIFAARINISGEIGGGADYEKIVKSFFLLNDPGDGIAYMKQDFSFALEANNPLLASYPGQATPAVPATTTYGGSSQSFPSSQLNPVFLDTLLFGDFITCIAKIEFVSSGVGTKTWKTTYQVVDLQGATRTLGVTTTTHSDTINSLSVWFGSHWLDPTGGQQALYNWQRMDLRWFYYSGDVTDQTAYTLRDSLPLDGRHVFVDIASNGFVFALPGTLGNVAIDASPGTNINIFNLYQRTNILSTQQLAEYVYALLAQGGGIIVADTPVNIDQIAGVALLSGQMPVNLVQAGGATLPMAGADAQTAGNVPENGIALFNGTNMDRWRSGQGDGSSTGLANIVGFLFNGTNFDRERGNINTAALITAVAATIGQTGADQTNFNGRGLIVVLDMTNVGTGSVTLVIQGKDAASGKYYPLLTGVAVITNSVNVYTVYPGAPTTANVSASSPLPRTWRVLTNANNANAASYVVGASVIL